MGPTFSGNLDTPVVVFSGTICPQSCSKFPNCQILSDIGTTLRTIWTTLSEKSNHWCSLLSLGTGGQRKKNVQVYKQRLCRFFPSLDKLCDQFYAVLSQKWVILQFCTSGGNTFNLVNVYFYFKRGTNTINSIFLASLDVWQFCFAPTYCQIQFMMFCCKLTFVRIYALFQVIFFRSILACIKKNLFFHVCRGVSLTQQSCSNYQTRLILVDN